MKITCKNKGANKLISVDTEYEVINESETRYTILNDSGVQKNYAKKLFDVVEEDEPEPAVRQVRERAPRAPRQPRQAPPVPVEPVIPVVNELTITTSAGASDNRNIIFTINVDFINNFRLNNTFNSFIINNSNISCGIRECDGLNGFMNNFTDFVQQFRNYIRNHNNDFRLNPDINIEETINEIADGLWQDFISIFEAGQYRAGIVTLSTNVTNNGTLSEIVINSLEKIAQNTVQVLNRNSNNEIKHWLLTIETEE